MSETPVVHKAKLTILSTLKPHPRNYREHPEDQLLHLEQSIREHGFYRNLVVANDGTILAGHGITRAALRLGIEKGPAIHLPIGPEDPKALKILAGDNEIGRLAEIDDRGLSELLKEIGSADLDGLLGTGYDEHMLANLIFVTRPSSEIETTDHAKHWVGLPGYEATDRITKLVVNFDTLEERVAFLELIGVETIHKTTNGVQSVWWPPREREDPSALRFEGAE